MSITLVPCNTRCLNMGDVAMLQVAVARLRARWPGETLRIFTSDPDALLRHCPRVTPVRLPDYPDWCTDRYLGGRLHAWLPEAWSAWLVDRYVRLSCRTPARRERLLRTRALLRREDRTSLRVFLDAIARSRLLVVTGAGGIADGFHDYANLVLLALQCAHRRGIPTAMVSQGFGPLTAPALRAKAAAVLPSVDTIAVREERASRPLLASLGVADDRVVTTGDDGIELAYGARPAALGEGLGISLRIARAAAVTVQDIGVVREGLRRFLAACPAPLVPLPIARQQDLDARAIAQLRNGLVGAGSPGASADGRELDTPSKVIDAAGRCRVVVTGAYHAAVFALAQGVPAVCLARSPYVVDKFLGLADQFRVGCHIVDLNSTDVAADLADTTRQAWNEAPWIRDALIGAAMRQTAQGHALYQRLPASFPPRSAPLAALLF